MSDNNGGATNGASRCKIVCNGGQLTAEQGIEIEGNSAEMHGLTQDEPAVAIPLIPNKEKVQEEKE